MKEKKPIKPEKKITHEERWGKDALAMGWTAIPA
ncbi:helix-turn-helix domain-containing protein, partial [Vibrio paracholerae]